MIFVHGVQGGLSRRPGSGHVGATGRIKAIVDTKFNKNGRISSRTRLCREGGRIRPGAHRGDQSLEARHDVLVMWSADSAANSVGSSPVGGLGMKSMQLFAGCACRTAHPLPQPPPKENTRPRKVHRVPHVIGRHRQRGASARPLLALLLLRPPQIAAHRPRLDAGTRLCVVVVAWFDLIRGDMLTALLRSGARAQALPRGRHRRRSASSWPVEAGERSAEPAGGDVHPMPKSALIGDGAVARLRQAKIC